MNLNNQQAFVELQLDRNSNVAHVPILQKKHES